MSAERSVPVALGSRSYEVVIGGGLLRTPGSRIKPFAPSGRAFVITDETVQRLHGASLEQALEWQGLAHRWVVLPPGEATKSFAGLEHVCEELLAAGIDRKDLVIAFGGGVIGDLAGFAAGIIKRGVDFVQIPTTLLAQVDSSVGGKTAIDARAGKNLVGLFHQPRLVLADRDLLQTLPEREIRCGYAEIVKIGLLGDARFFDWLEDAWPRVVALEPEALGHAVATAVQAKAAIVAADEREAGPRALLNLGHTFAHALETEAGFDGALLHGEAVAAGMAAAFRLSERLGLCPRADVERVEAHLAAAGFELDLRRLPGAPAPVERLLEHMAQDKKAEGGRLTFVLVRGIGRAEVFKDAPREAVRAFLEVATGLS